jgi:hypothetical protein
MKKMWHKAFSKKGLWVICRVLLPKKQTQFKANRWPLAGNPENEFLNSKQDNAVLLSSVGCNYFSCAVLQPMLKCTAIGVGFIYVLKQG